MPGGKDRQDKMMLDLANSEAQLANSAAKLLMNNLKSSTAYKTKKMFTKAKIGNLILAQLESSKDENKQLKTYLVKKCGKGVLTDFAMMVGERVLMKQSTDKLVTEFLAGYQIGSQDDTDALAKKTTTVEDKSCVFTSQDLNAAKRKLKASKQVVSSGFVLKQADLKNALSNLKKTEKKSVGSKIQNYQPTVATNENGKSTVKDLVKKVDKNSDGNKSGSRTYKNS